MERFFDNDADIAAPTVPDDREKAAGRMKGCSILYYTLKQRKKMATGCISTKVRS